MNYHKPTYFTSFLYQWLLCLTVLIALGLGFSPVASANSPANNLLQHWQEKIHEQQTELTEEQSRLTEVEQSAQRYLDNLQRNIQIMDLQLNYYQTELEENNRQLQELSAQLNQERQVYAPQLEATVARLRFLQRQSLSSQGWRFLLHSENLNDFFDRRARLKLVYEADREKLAKLQQKSDKIKAQKYQVQEQSQKIAELTQQIATQKSDIEAQFTIQQQLLNQLGGDLAALKAVQEKLAEDSEGISRLIQKRARGSNPIILGGTGQFAVPHQGPVTSTFGWRQHPVLGGKRLHGGIDFAGDVGSPIYASDSGTVIFSGWYGGYGRTVVIDHGDGLTTLYGHASKLYVSEGQPVKQGEAIAEVGTTGLSTGPHLHFEIRRNSQPIDPLTLVQVPTEQLGQLP
ncbi:murein hydrolase activator EnvC family protein [Spirulina subsalsa]|nr:M23 family metallopeptidase [Spirulina subsalsa]